MSHVYEFINWIAELFFGLNELHQACVCILEGEECFFRYSYIFICILFCRFEEMHYLCSIKN